MRRVALASAIAAAGAATAIALSAVPSAPASPAAPAARGAKLSVGVAVLHFNSSGRVQKATGLVQATLRYSNGSFSTVKTPVAIVAATGRNCRVLHLFLQQLNLTLLGLNVHLSKVVLDITGNPHGGVLGSLFCALARAKVSSARAASAAHALNAALARHPMHVIRVNTSLTPQQLTSGTTCPVLDLILGPLNLQLLGLVVNLNQVHLTITATRGAGVLGDLFCTLADNSTVPTTTT
jgi:hypothetical protein